MRTQHRAPTGMLPAGVGLLRYLYSVYHGIYTYGRNQTLKPPPLNPQESTYFLYTWVGPGNQEYIVDWCVCRQREGGWGSRGEG